MRKGDVESFERFNGAGRLRHVVYNHGLMVGVTDFLEGAVRVGGSYCESHDVKAEVTGKHVG